MLFSCSEGEFMYETISIANLTHEEWLRLRDCRVQSYP